MGLAMVDYSMLVCEYQELLLLLLLLLLPSNVSVMESEEFTKNGLLDVHVALCFMIVFKSKVWSIFYQS